MISLSTQPSENPQHHLRTSFETLFSEPPFLVLALSLAVNLLLAYVLLFQQSTTFVVFFLSNSPLYIGLSIVLTILISLLTGVALSQAIYVARTRLAVRRAQGTGRGVFGSALGAIAASCPACGSALLPALGIAGSLAVFPLQGLEIKMLSLVILGDAIWEGSRTIAGVCELTSQKIVEWNDDRILIRFNRRTLARLRPVLLIALVAMAVYLLPALPAQYKLNFAAQTASASASAPTVAQEANDAIDGVSLLAQVLPEDGYTINASYGDIGPQVLAAGAIDYDRFVELYASNGNPLTDDQLAILTEGSDAQITINRGNAHFLLNFFWALGLANSNSILNDGPLAQNGEGQIGRFASTGGWTLGTKQATDLYSQSTIITLTPEQQRRVEEAADNTYRPCCNNSTAFADCNHGMAMLGLFEVMAAEGASVDEMFEAAKYFNAFWFPQQYVDLAVYFKASQGLDFAEVDARTIVGEDHSSANGWTSVRQWLASNNLLEEAPGGGGGCGV
jgi:hypothetical protein